MSTKKNNGNKKVLITQKYTIRKVIKSYVFYGIEIANKTWNKMNIYYCNAIFGETIFYWVPKQSFSNGNKW